ncbi:hypothetical protein L3X38_042626 [Prunus dulcis]|uniref:BURP domain-containing protein n=1 Tax=Prunus dulcis TaxID=3755 RepID=A0AAD4YLH4_PRUDU|nr:hypothetical protein L3X38_042626 [Prunus dulcis]
MSHQVRVQAALFTCCLLILSSHSILGEELWEVPYLCTYLESYKVENQHQRESQQQRDHSVYLKTILGFKIRSKGDLYSQSLVVEFLEISTQRHTHNIPFMASITSTVPAPFSSAKTNIKTPPHVLKPPFPSRLAPVKKKKTNRDIFEELKKVQVNIPLLDAIKSIPSYAKFLKELCTNKRKIQEHSEVFVSE